MKKKLFYILCLTIASIQFPCTASGASPYGSGWYNEAGFSVAYQDNISRASRTQDFLSDTISSITVGRGYLKKTGTSSQVIVSGYFTYSAHADYKALDNLASALEFQFIRQPSAGFYNVWYESSLRVTRLDYRDSDVREGYLLEVAVGLNKRITTQLTGRMGYRYANFGFPGKSGNAKQESQAFDTLTNELYMGIDYEFRPGVFVYAEYAYLTGNFTSSVPRIHGWGNDYDAESMDWAFKTCVDEACKPRWAYRADGDIQRADAGLSWPLFGLNFDLSARYYKAEAESGTSYRDWSVQLGTIWHF